MFSHNKVGDPHPGVPHLTSKRSALRFEGFLLLGRELGDADARGRPHEGEEDGDPVGDRPRHVGEGGDAQGAGHVGARRRPRQDGLPHGGRILDGSRQVLRVQAPLDVLAAQHLARDQQGHLAVRSNADDR